MTKSAEKPKKPRGRPFMPGNSANPGGRPKLPEDVKHVRELAREYTADAVHALADTMRNGSGAARVAAANALLDRGWGRPESNTNVTVTRNVRDLSTAEILSLLAAEGIAGEEAGGGEPGRVH